VLDLIVLTQTFVEAMKVATNHKVNGLRILPATFMCIIA
jgi:hypothetical protein